MKGFIWSKLHLHSWSASTACQKWTEDTKSVVQSSEEKNQFFLINVAVKKISFLRNVLELKLDKAYRPVASQPASPSQQSGVFFVENFIILWPEFCAGVVLLGLPRWPPNEMTNGVLCRRMVSYVAMHQQSVECTYDVGGEKFCKLFRSECHTRIRFQEIM